VYSVGVPKGVPPEIEDDPKLKRAMSQVRSIHSMVSVFVLWVSLTASLLLPTYDKHMCNVQVAHQLQL